jgi:hypothetical protein
MVTDLNSPGPAIDENDPANGCGWIKFKDSDTIEGEFRFHMGDDSTFLARRAKK